jgi:hypothetical protein
MGRRRRIMMSFSYASSVLESREWKRGQPLKARGVGMARGGERGEDLA